MSECRLVNRRNVKRYIHEQLAAKRPHLDMQRISHEVYPKLEAKVRAILDRSIQQHPTRGKTFKELL